MLNYEWMLMVFGLTMVVTKSHILESVRTLVGKVHPILGKLVSCPMCFGFWAAIIMNLLGYSHIGDHTEMGLLMDGFIGSASSSMLYGMFAYLTASSSNEF